MDITGIGAPPEDTLSRRARIGQEDFLQVLLAQLQFQDPLEPLDNNEFIAQFAELTNLEQTQQFNEKLDTLLSQQNASQAIGLIGRSVQVVGDTGNNVGEVIAVAFQNGSPSMTVRASSGLIISDISLGQISVIR